MAKFIGIEIMAANALIYNLEKNKKDFVTLDNVRRYAESVSQKLYDMGTSNAILYGGDRFADYETYLHVDFEKGIVTICDKINSQVLREKFRAPLSLEVYVACIQTEKDIRSGKTFQEEDE